MFLISDPDLAIKRPSIEVIGEVTFLSLDTDHQITESFIKFIENNIKANPGKAILKFNVTDIRNNIKLSFYNIEKGFTMNDDMAAFLQDNPDVDVSVVSG